MLLREARAAGYEGGISQLKAYLAPYKIAPVDPAARLETEPGRHMQADLHRVLRSASRETRAELPLSKSRICPTTSAQIATPRQFELLYQRRTPTSLRRIAVSERRTTKITAFVHSAG